MNDPPPRLRLATAWLAGCSGCHMSFLDLGERLVELFSEVDLVYGPLVDGKAYPEGVDVALVEGAVATEENRMLLEHIRARTRLLVSFGDCAVTGNVTALRNYYPTEELLAAVYPAAAGCTPAGPELPALLTRVLPLHQIVAVDAFIPGCPPEPDRIWAALSALRHGETVRLGEEQRTFG